MNSPPIIFLITATLIMGGCSLVTDGENYTELRRPRFCSINNTIEHQTPDTLRVVSYNIKFAKKASLVGDLFLNHEDLCRADVIFLQEMDREGVESIARKLNYNYIYYPAVRHPLSNRDFGNAILTKWPIVYDQKLILPHHDPDDLQRVVVGAGLKIGPHLVMAYSIHMSIWLHPYQRKEQLETLFANIPSRFDAYIIGGDFNTYTKYNRKTVFEALTGAGFNLATSPIKWTYKHWYLLNKKSLVDYIFVKNLEPVGAGTVANRRASDHLPVWTDLKLIDQPTAKK